MENERIQEQLRIISQKIQLNKKLSSIRNIIHKNPEIDNQLILETLLPTAQKHLPTNNLNNTQASIHEISQTIALQTMQFQQLLLQNLVPNFYKNNLLQSNNTRSLENSSSQTDDVLISNIEAINTNAVNNHATKIRPKIIRPANINTSKRDNDYQNNDVENLESPDIAQEELVQKDLHMILKSTFLAVLFIEYLKKSSRETLKRSSGQIGILSAGERKLATLFKLKPELSKAIEIITTLSSEGVDLTPKKNIFRITRIFASGANPKVVLLLESLIKCVELTTLENTKSLRGLARGIIHAFSLIFSGNFPANYFWRNELSLFPKLGTDGWPYPMSNGQITALMSGYVINRILLRMLSIYGEMNSSKTKNDLLIKNTRIVCFIIYRIVRGANALASGNKIEDVPYEFFRDLEIQNAAIFQDFQFKLVYKMYEPTIISGEKRIATWAIRYYSEFTRLPRDLEAINSSSVKDLTRNSRIDDIILPKDISSTTKELRKSIQQFLNVTAEDLHSPTVMHGESLKKSPETPAAEIMSEKSKSKSQLELNKSLEKSSKIQSQLGLNKSLEKIHSQYSNEIEKTNPNPQLGLIKSLEKLNTDSTSKLIDIQSQSQSRLNHSLNEETISKIKTASVEQLMEDLAVEIKASNASLNASKNSKSSLN